jgi:hypothetical protein
VRLTTKDGVYQKGKEVAVFPRRSRDEAKREPVRPAIIRELYFEGFAMVEFRDGATQEVRMAEVILKDAVAPAYWAEISGETQEAAS